VLEHCSQEVLADLHLSAHMLLGTCAFRDGPGVGVGRWEDWRPRTFELSSSGSPF
jgi:hypothetical protein